MCVKVQIYKYGLSKKYKGTMNLNTAVKVLNHVRKSYLFKQLNRHRKKIYRTQKINLYTFHYIGGFCQGGAVVLDPFRNENRPQIITFVDMFLFTVENCSIN